MAKTYEELLEQAAIIRDETAAGKNTATRVGGTITDAVDYVKELQDTYAGIHAEAAEAKTTANAAKVTAAEAKTNAGSARSIAQSALLSANAAKATANGIAATAQEAKEAAEEAQTAAADLRANIKELGAFDTFAALFAQAAKFEIVSNNAIALLHGTYKQADGIYHGVLIFQQVEKNNDGGGTAMQYIYIEKRKYTRYIYFSQTAVTAVQGVQNDGVRNLSLSGRWLQMKDMWGNNVGSGATIPDNGNLREGSAGTLSVPVVLSKTFGGTVTATLGAATSARAGVMTAADKTKLDNLLQDTPWEGQHMNAFTETGEYHIHGERTDANDGLPILNAASGHTIDARLTVLDSSLTNGTGAKTDIVVTQILRLSNRTGGDGHVYVRTAQAANKSQIATPSSTAWGTWEKLMGIFEKNVVDNAYELDGYTTNGMYSGMFPIYQQNWGLAIPAGSTFLMVTINGYAVAAYGAVPQLTQMLYLLPAKTGSEQFPAKMYIRTAWWNASAKDWVWNYWDKIVTASELSALEARVAALEAK